MARTIVVTAWHPYPTFEWQFRRGGALWAPATGDIFEPGDSYTTDTLLVKDVVVEGQQCDVQCVITGPDGKQVITDTAFITVGDLVWTTDLEEGLVKTIQGFTTVATFTSETDADATFGWEWRVAGGEFAPLSTGDNHFAYTLSAPQPRITTLTIDNAYIVDGTPWEFRVTATDANGNITQTHTLHVVAGA